MMCYDEFIEEWKNDSEVIECVTSGSTGTPKHIFLPKDEMRKSAWRTIEYFGLKEGLILYSCISPAYIGGKMMAVRADLCKGVLLYEQPSNRPLAYYAGERIDLLSVVPSQMLYILEHLSEMPEIGNILIGGSAIPVALRKRISESGLNAWETYGMTETASHIALRKVTTVPEPFLPLAGIRVSRGKDDCMIIDIPGWRSFHTNDLVEMTPEGGFHIRGRKDAVIITGGKKVNPQEIEDILEQKFGAGILVTSFPDEMWGERVVYLIEDTSGSIDENMLRDYCKTSLPAEARPKEIIFGEVPLTPNGKKDRKSNILHLRSLKSPEQ